MQTNGGTMNEIQEMVWTQEQQLIVLCDWVILRRNADCNSDWRFDNQNGNYNQSNLTLMMTSAQVRKSSAWCNFFFLHGNKTGIRERVRWVHLARSGSQSELAYLSYMYVIPAWGVFHSEPADIWLVLFWVSVSQIFFRWLDSDRTNCGQKHHAINANGQREKLQNDK